MRSALRRLLDAACQRRPEDGLAPATELWNVLVVPSLCADAATAAGRPMGPWGERLARVRWVGLPLLHSVREPQLLEELLRPIFPQLRALLDAANPGKEGKHALFSPLSIATLGTTMKSACHTAKPDGAALPPAVEDAAASVHIQLTRSLLACEVLGGLMGRLGRSAKLALEPGGALSPTEGSEAGTDLFKWLVKVLSFLSSKVIQLPPALEVGEVAPAAGSAASLAQALRRAVHASAFAAFVEAIVQTQVAPKPIEKTVFKNAAGIWELAVDPAHSFKLTATTSFAVTSDAALLALQGHATPSRPDGDSRGAGAAYLPSQALLGSSLSQAAHDIGWDGEGTTTTATTAPAATQAAASQVAASQASQASQGGGRARRGEPAREVKVEDDELGNDDDDGDSRQRRGGGGGGGGGVVLIDGYELDELSKHPMMSTMLRAIAELRQKGLEAPATVDILCGPDSDWKMPAWMHALYTQMIKGDSEAERARLALEQSLQHDASAPHVPGLKAAFKEAEARFAKTLNTRLIIARLAYNLTRYEKKAAAEKAAEEMVAEDGGDGGAGSARAVKPTTFESFARLWARPLLRVVLDSLKRPDACFHYLARDVIALVAEWQLNERKRAENGVGVAVDLLQSTATTPAQGAPIVDPLMDDLIEKLMEKCADEATVDKADSVFKLLRENVRVVKTLIEVWRDRLHLRRFILFGMLMYKKADEASKKGLANQETRFRLTAAHLCSALLANGFGLDDDPSWMPYVYSVKAGDFVPYKPPAGGAIGKLLLVNAFDERKQLPGVKAPPKPRNVLFKPTAAVLGMEMGRLCKLRGGLEPSTAAVVTAEQQLDHLERELMRRLASLQDGTQESLARLILILHELASFYPQALMLNHAQYGLYTRALLTKVFGSARVQVLACLKSCVLIETPSVQPMAAAAVAGTGRSDMEVDAGLGEFKVDLGAAELQLVLQQQQGEVQLAALKLVSAMLHMRGALAVAPLVPVLNKAFDKHKDVGCRWLHLELLKKIRDEPTMKQAYPEASSAATAALLRGLSDPDEGSLHSRATGGDGLRSMVTAYWHSEVLKPSLRKRMISCFEELHASDVESRWLHYCGVLLLQLPLGSANASKRELAEPLVDKDGVPVALFANVNAVPNSASASAVMRPWGSHSQSQSSQDGSDFGGLRATLSQRLFTQTQASQGGGGMGLPSTYSTQDPGAATSLWGGMARRPPVPIFAAAAEGASQASQGSNGGSSQWPSSSQPAAQSSFEGEASSFGKRFKHKAGSAAAPEASILEIRQARAIAATKQRGAAVSAFRTYRKGELPDVAITARDLLAPLQALVHHDPLVAKLAFAQLYTTVRRELDESSAGRADLGRLHDGVNALLGSRHGGPAFVGCLHELALSEGSEGSGLTWLPAELAAESAKASDNMHSGILILEQHLAACEPGGASADATGERGGGRKAKRERTSAVADAGAAGSLEAQTAEMGVKMHLADLYRAIGDEDVVRGISCEMTTSEHVRQALASETRGDAAVALGHYNKARTPEDDAMNGGGGGGGASALPTWEGKLIERGVLEAHALLNEWEHVARLTAERMERACGAGRSSRPAAAIPSDGGEARGPLTFGGSLSEGWVRLWIASHAKRDGAQQKDAATGWANGWGAWPGTESQTPSATAGGALPSSSALVPPGAPQPRRDATPLLEAGHGSLLLLDGFAADDLNSVRALLPRCVHAFVRRWATLHPLAEQARLAELRPLQMLAEAAEVTTLLEEGSTLSIDASTEAVVRSAEHVALLKSWAVRLPSVAHHDTCAWDDLICSRQRLLRTLRDATVDRLGSSVAGAAFIDGGEQRTFLKALDDEHAHAMLALYEAAAAAMREQGNFNAATSYLKETSKLRLQLGLPKDSPGFVCSVLHLQLQRSRARDGSGPKWRKALNDVHQKAEEKARLVHSSGPGGGAAPAAEVCQLRALQAHVAWELAALPPADDGAVADERTAGGSTASDLVHAAYTALKLNADAPGLGSSAAERKRHAGMRLELVDLCDKVMAKGADVGADVGSGVGGGRLSRPELASVAIEQVIRAMAGGSLEARERLPSALALCRTLPEFWPKATELLELPPLWMSLAWAPQMIAMLYESHGAVVAPLLQRLTAAYPQALYFPYHVSRAALAKSAAAADPVRAVALRAMDAALRSPIIEGLVRGFSDLTQPHLRMTDLLRELHGKLDDGDGEAAAELYRSERAAWMMPRLGADRKDERGEVLIAFTKADQPHMKGLEACCGKDGARLKAVATALPLLKKHMQTTANREKLKDWDDKKTRELKGRVDQLKIFSATLAMYQRADAAAHGPLDFIELPGQYARDTPPQPSTHVRLEGFDPTLRTMNSLRMPKAVKLLGSDQREHAFLVKGGEDLRLDQRVQILFGSMSRALAEHAPASQRGLGLRTYAVLPLSEHVGIIEWVGGTDTLKSLIGKEAKKRPCHRSTGDDLTSMAMGRYINELYPEGSASYVTKMHSMPRKDLVAKFTQIEQSVPCDLLSRAVHALSVSSEVYLAMRSRFARSLATLTACMHILGIGDRHLDNFLLHLPTGNVVGIDFGHAFGSATYLLPVPELVGVRLTRQLTSFLKPLDTSVLLSGHMEITLEALRNRRSDLMRLLEVFLSEPIVDWEAQSRKLSAEQRLKLENDASAYSSLPTEGGAAGATMSASTAVGASGASAGAGGLTRGGSARVSMGSFAASGAGPADAGLMRKWAQARLLVVDSKLRGGNAAHLTVRDLASNSNGHIKKNLAAIESVVMGPESCKRRTSAAENLSIGEQVAVLIEQATDPNILGRTWQGWAPFL